MEHRRADEVNLTRGSAPPRPTPAARAVPAVEACAKEDPSPAIRERAEHAVKQLTGKAPMDEGSTVDIHNEDAADISHLPVCLALSKPSSSAAIFSSRECTPSVRSYVICRHII